MEHLADITILQEKIGSFDRLDLLLKAFGGARIVNCTMEHLAEVGITVVCKESVLSFIVPGIPIPRVCDVEDLTINDLLFFVRGLEEFQKGLVADIIDGKFTVEIKDNDELFLLDGMITMLDGHGGAAHKKAFPWMYDPSIKVFYLEWKDDHLISTEESYAKAS